MWGTGTPPSEKKDCSTTNFLLKPCSLYRHLLRDTGWSSCPHSMCYLPRNALCGAFYCVLSSLSWSEGDRQSFEERCHSWQSQFVGLVAHLSSVLGEILLTAQGHAGWQWIGVRAQFLLRCWASGYHVAHNQPHESMREWLSRKAHWHCQGRTWEGDFITADINIRRLGQSAGHSSE